MNPDLRYRYVDHNGRVIWLVFDPAFPCIYCDCSVDQLSTAGPAVCPGCSVTGGAEHHGEDRYSWSGTVLATQHARQRLIDLPDDPVWAEYEAAHQKWLALRKATTCVGGSFPDIGFLP